MTVTWEPVPPSQRLGAIVGYQVRYRQDQFDESDGVVQMGVENTSLLVHTLEGLEQDVQYNVSVRAVNSAGPGPYSPVVMNTTFMDSK